MKELTIEEKARRYDEAYKKVAVRFGSNVADEIFLKESEDERIRKEMIEILKNEAHEFPASVIANKSNSWIAWLEKQDKQKPINKVEPKFKVGDWVVYDHRTYQIVELPQGRLINASLSRNGKTEQVPLPYCEKWSIQDAKGGDVLCYKNEIFIVEKSVNLNIIYYCCYDSKRFIIDSFYSLTIDDIDNIRPATKEQRDTLFTKMKEAGYEWDSERKELKKIEQKPATMSLDEAIEHCKEKSCGNSACALEHKQLEKWLTELKELKEQKPTWSEEDEAHIMAIDLAVNRCLGKWHCCGEKCPISEHNPWLKSLKDRVQPQSTWKPSDEQIKALADALSLAKNCGEEIAFDLRTLHEQLKKLKG